MNERSEVSRLERLVMCLRDESEMVQAVCAESRYRKALLAEAAERIECLRDAANVALGCATGGMDGDWRDCDHVALLRYALHGYEPHPPSRQCMCRDCAPSFATDDT